MTDRKKTPIYAVVDRDAVISMDLVETLREAGPCKVYQYDSIADFRADLARYERLTAAFLETGYDGITREGLDRSLERLGARIVMTAGEADAPRVADRGWKHLVRPFTGEMVRESLA